MPSKAKIELMHQLQLMDIATLSKKIQDSKLRLKKLKYTHTISPLDNPMIMRHLRKDIARMQTLLHQKKNVK